jgi:glycosyltransferase involved in cell wall biosynthesis
MRILQAAHSYLPDRNGIAEVVARISEGLLARGHEVHVATGASPGRSSPTTNINGVTVHSFAIQGEWLRGMRGPVGDYVDFVLRGNWDVVVNHAGQSWPFDALLDHLPTLNAGRVYVPHGMSAIHDPHWAAYFRRMPEILAQYDHVCCLSETFDEKPFCARYGIRHCSVIPNGIELVEFEQPSLGVRARWEIGEKFMIPHSSRSATASRRVATISEDSEFEAGVTTGVCSSRLSAERFAPYNTRRGKTSFQPIKKLMCLC